MLFFLAEPLFAKPVTADACTKNCCGKKQDDKNKCPAVCNPFFSCAYCQYISKKPVEIAKAIQSADNRFFEMAKQNTEEGYLLACWKPPNNFFIQ